MTTFYLGAHHPHWLRVLDVPLFVSHHQLRKYKKLPRARVPWALDSGGFTHVKKHGAWLITAEEYVAAVRRYADEVGNMQWAAPRDWMCEEFILKRTGLSVAEHQRRTVEDYLRLRDLAPELPFIPVLQGWSLSDYWRCAELYDDAGIDLAALPLVGVGSICRRQHTVKATHILHTLAADGLKLHGFGFKLQGLRNASKHLASADSLAWSYNAWRHPPLPGHEARHKNCANCVDWALMWRDKALQACEEGDRAPLSSTLPLFEDHL